MPKNFSALVISAVLAMAGSAAFAQPVALEDKLIERGAVADATPQQRYQTAIKEAGGGYKLYLAECAAMAAAERTACRREAKTLYDRDMAAARAMLRGK